VRRYIRMTFLGFGAWYKLLNVLDLAAGRLRRVMRGTWLMAYAWVLRYPDAL